MAKGRRQPRLNPHTHTHTHMHIHAHTHTRSQSYRSLAPLRTCSLFSPNGLLLKFDCRIATGRQTKHIRRLIRRLQAKIIHSPQRTCNVEIRYRGESTATSAPTHTHTHTYTHTHTSTELSFVGNFSGIFFSPVRLLLHWCSC